MRGRVQREYVGAALDAEERAEKRARTERRFNFHPRVAHFPGRTSVQSIEQGMVAQCLIKLRVQKMQRSSFVS